MKHYEALVNSIRPYGRLAVAFSGGADSSLLLLAARDALGADAVRAYSFVSELTPGGDPAAAEALAGELGVALTVVNGSELSEPDIAANGRRRCYYCKRSLFSKLKALAMRDGFPHVAEGTNSDDLKEYRPGLAAIEELGILSPLRDNGLSKADVRRLLQEKGVSVHSRPSSPCLATRIPYGTRLTNGLLRTVDEGERLLKNAGFTRCRLRHHGDTARIEVPLDELALVIQSGVAGQIRALGFVYVTLDLFGFRSGSMDEPFDDDTNLSLKW